MARKDIDLFYAHRDGTRLHFAATSAERNVIFVDRNGLEAKKRAFAWGCVVAEAKKAAAPQRTIKRAKRPKRVER